MRKQTQRGFTSIEIILALIAVVVLIGFTTWWVFRAQKDDKQSIISGSLVAEDRERLEAEQVENPALTQTVNEPNTSASTPSQTQQEPSRPSSTNSGSRQTNTSGSGSSAGSNQSNTTTNTSTPPAPTTITRPTAAFCQQKNGASFDAWATDNSNHSYQVWENNGWVNKTETGTAAYNFDTMQVVGVVPHLTKAAWAICNQRAGYLTFYYKPNGSVYTYNWLIPFEHLSVTQP